MVNPFDIITEFYEPGSAVCEMFVRHGEQVAQKAAEVANRNSHLSPNLEFIEEAAMLHDIAIFMTNAPGLSCFGAYPYVCHGYLGRELLEKKGLPRHALVCERHVGVGITLSDIRQQNLPFPPRDMRPVSAEEQIICYADKFFSKNGASGQREKTTGEIMQGLEPYGQKKVAQFQAWVDQFGE